MNTSKRISSHRLLPILLVLVLSSLACLSNLPALLPGGSQPAVDENSELVPAEVIGSGEDSLTVSDDSGREVVIGDGSAESGAPQEVDGNTFLASGADLSAVYDTAVRGVVSIRILSDLGDGQGSGFVVDNEGHIVTNFHVIEGAQAIEVGFWNGLKTRGTVIGTDLDSDLAVVQVDVPDDQLFPLPLGDSDQLRVGEVVIAIGSPFGLGSSMTVGILSAKGRVLTSLNDTGAGGFFSAGDLLQTDAAINPGNSGGPLLNLNGEVIGINRAIRTESFTGDGSPVNSGIGFAISINILKRVVPSLIENGEYAYPLLGISSLPEITIFDQEQFDLPQTTGAYVISVPTGGPADEAGILIGDLITHIDGQEIMNFGDLLSYLLTSKSPGDEVTLSIYRDGETLEITLALGSRG